MMEAAGAGWLDVFMVIFSAVRLSMMKMRYWVLGWDRVRLWATDAPCIMRYILCPPLLAPKGTPKMGWIVVDFTIYLYYTEAIMGLDPLVGICGHIILTVMLSIRLHQILLLHVCNS